MQVEQLQQAIEVLSEEDFIQLRQWFAEKDWERWDRQLESDVAAGKLDFLLNEALQAEHQDNVTKTGSLGFRGPCHSERSEESRRLWDASLRSARHA